MIYFDSDKNAYGFAIENPLCAIEDSLWAQYAGTDKWDIIDGVFTDITDTEEYKKKKEEEKERISHLKCTKRVLALILQQLGIQYSTLKALIDRNEQAQLEWDLCVELERSNPLIDIIGEELGLTSNDIDNIFRYANGEIPNIEREGNDE
jgi:hypothetical protein